MQKEKGFRPSARVLNPFLLARAQISFPWPFRTTILGTVKTSQTSFWPMIRILLLTKSWPHEKRNKRKNFEKFLGD